MEELLKKMDAFWDTHEATIAEENGRGIKFFNTSEDKEASEIESEIFDKAFNGSSWNYANKAKFEEHGYNCRVFERDSFGILVAGIGKFGKYLSLG